MTALSEANFKQNYQTHFEQPKLKGLQPKTIEAYARAIRRIGQYFDWLLLDSGEIPSLGDNPTVAKPVSANSTI